MPRHAPLEIKDAELPRLIRGVGAQHLDDDFWIGALLQLAEHEHLVLMCAVHAGLARSHPNARHDHGLHAHEKGVVVVNACGRCNDQALV